MEENEGNETDDFVMVEEFSLELLPGSSEATFQNVDSSTINNKQTSNAKIQNQRVENNIKMISLKPINDVLKSTEYIKRTRSQSENITSYSIFRFMENNLASHKNSLN